jgi:prepilin-type processing-associated H-X9-DG protein
MPWASPEVVVGLREVFGGLHRGGVNLCLADGSVRFFPRSTGYRVLGKLCTRAGGEPIGANDF